MNNKDLEQKKHIEAWINNNCKGTSVAATGIGKTKMGLMAIEYILSKNKYNKALNILSKFLSCLSLYFNSLSNL